MKVTMKDKLFTLTSVRLYYNVAAKVDLEVLA